MNTINAPKGMWLTQANPDTPAQERIYVTSVSGFGDINALYRTATEEEKRQAEVQQQILNEQSLNEQSHGE